MTEERINAYEGLFLFPQTIGGDLQAAVDHIKEILTKSDAEPAAPAIRRDARLSARRHVLAYRKAQETEMADRKGAGIDELKKTLARQEKEMDDNASNPLLHRFKNSSMIFIL